MRDTEVKRERRRVDFYQPLGAVRMEETEIYSQSGCE